MKLNLTASLLNDTTKVVCSSRRTETVDVLVDVSLSFLSRFSVFNLDVGLSPQSLQHHHRGLVLPPVCPRGVSGQTIVMSEEEEAEKGCESVEGSEGCADGGGNYLRVGTFSCANAQTHTHARPGFPRFGLLF